MKFMRWLTGLLLAFCAVTSFGSLPLRFEPNVGQSDPSVQFLARSAGATIFITSEETVASFGDCAMRIRLNGARANAVASGSELLPGKSNYFTGNDPKKWRTNVPQYARVTMEDVYPNIDLAFHGATQKLEFDFIVKPGGDPRAIELHFEGADDIRIEPSGDLVMKIGGRQIRQTAPVVYQEFRGRRERIHGGYVQRSRTDVAFRIGDFDPERSLVIDPVLVYSTYLGGSSSDDTTRIAVDSSGNVYIAGSTYSTDFPTHDPYQGSKAGMWDIFVGKMNAAGSALIYSTYIGGNDMDGAKAIAIDASGNAYVAGNSQSTDFPLSEDGQTYAGVQDAVVLKLNDTGSQLVFSTYFGSSQSSEDARAIAVDPTRYTWIAGLTNSDDLAVNCAGGGDAFVARLDWWGRPAMSTCIGGTALDEGNAIALTPAGSALVVGTTSSSNFPTTTNAYQKTRPGLSDAFISEVRSNGSYAYGSFLGTNDNDKGTGVAIANGERVYIAGQQQLTGHGVEVFVTKFTSGWTFSEKALFGGTAVDMPSAIATDAAGAVYVTGKTNSTDFPTRSPIQATFGGGQTDAFVMKLSPALDPVYSTYVGGANADEGTAIAADTQSNAYVAGFTESADYPTASPLDGTLSGLRDDFVAKISATGTFGIPAGVTATGTASGVTVTWQPVAGATQYAIVRRAVNGPWQEIVRTSATTYDDSPLPAFTAYAYAVRVVAAEDGLSSEPDYAVVFAADSLVAHDTCIHAHHVHELRQAIDVLRAFAGLSPFGYSCAAAEADVIHMFDLWEMRVASAEARKVLGLPTFAFTSFAPGDAIRAQHVEELRQSIR